MERSEEADAAAPGIEEMELRLASQLTFYYVSYLMALGRCARVRQRAINTAALLFRRFYRERPLTSDDPLLLVPTMLMMASKMEECYVAAAVLVRAMPRLEAELGCKNPYGVLHILEQEKAVLETLECGLDSCNPSAAVSQFLSIGCDRRAALAGGTIGDAAPGTATLADADGTGCDGWSLDLVAHAHFLVNDVCRTDAPVVYADHVIALACIVLACRATGRALPASLEPVALAASEAIDEVAGALGHMYASAMGDKGDGGLRCAKECHELHLRLSASHLAARARAACIPAAPAAGRAAWVGRVGGRW